MLWGEKKPKEVKPEEALLCTRNPEARVGQQMCRIPVRAILPLSIILLYYPVITELGSDDAGDLKDPVNPLSMVQT